MSLLRETHLKLGQTGAVDNNTGIQDPGFKKMGVPYFQEYP